VWVVRGRRADDLRVWTTICPHLGCSINCNADAATGFTCPCHDARYSADGALVQASGYSNPAPRGMDTLEFQIDPNDPDILLVDYKNFRQGEHEKIVKT
jgi:Rieske Fe-S protein